MSAVKKNLSFIKLLFTADAGQRTVLLQTISRPQSEALRQIVRNILEGGLVISQPAVRELKRYSGDLWKLANSKEKGRRGLCLKLKRAWPKVLKAVFPQLQLLE